MVLQLQIMNGLALDGVLEMKVLCSHALGVHITQHATFTPIQQEFHVPTQVTMHGYCLLNQQSA